MHTYNCSYCPLRPTVAASDHAWHLWHIQFFVELQQACRQHYTRQTVARFSKCQVAGSFDTCCMLPCCMWLSLLPLHLQVPDLPSPRPCGHQPDQGCRLKQNHPRFYRHLVSPTRPTGVQPRLAILDRIAKYCRQLVKCVHVQCLATCHDKSLFTRSPGNGLLLASSKRSYW